MIIEAYNYTGFIDYDRVQLRTASINAKITWLEYRLRKVLIDPLDQVFPPDGPCHQSVNQGDRTFNLCGVTLVACAIEGLGHFLTGNSDATGDSFKTWVRAYMPDWDRTTPQGVRIRDWLWDSARNGLAHQLAFKNGGTEAQGPGRFAEGTDGQIQMDPFVFYLDFKRGAVFFFRDITTNATIQTNFGNRFAASFLQLR